MLLAFNRPPASNTLRTTRQPYASNVTTTSRLVAKEPAATVVRGEHVRYCHFNIFRIVEIWMNVKH